MSRLNSRFRTCVIFIICAAFLVLGVALFGCSSSSSQSSSSTTSSASSSAAASSAATSTVITEKATDAKNTGPVTVQDIYGITWNFDKPLTKVIGTHNPTLNAVVVVGGGGQYLAGFGNKEKANGLYSLVIDNWDSLVSIGQGKNINLETVTSLSPELALVPERQAAMADTYSTIGLKTFVALPNQESFDTIKQSLVRVGTLFGEQARVEKINTEFDALIADASDTCASASEKPSVLFMGDDLYEVASSSMIQTDIISAVGATNAVSGDYTPGEFAAVDAETIVKFNPDVIWIPNYATYTVDDVLNDAGLANVTAVKNHKVYMFPSSLEPWDYPTASTCLGVCWAAYNLHPDLYTKDHLMQSADSFYTLVYGKTFTAEQLGIS